VIGGGFIAPGAAMIENESTETQTEYIEIIVTVSNSDGATEKIPVRISRNTSQSLPEEKYSDILSSEQYESIDNDGDGEITLEELVQTNVNRVNA
jgi:hypothetical protein